MIIDISCFADETVGLKSDGTVLYAGRADEQISAGAAPSPTGKDKVGGWKDIVDIAANRTGTWGLKSDGTCVGTGVITPKLAEAVSAWDLGKANPALPRVPRGRSHLLPWPGK